MEAAYQRDDVFDKRRKLMEASAAYCTATSVGKIVSLSALVALTRHDMPYPAPYQLNLVAQRIAKIAKVSAHYQHEFSERIVELVMSLREPHRNPAWGKPGGLLTEAANAARRLFDTFYRMNRRDRDWVEHVKQSRLQFVAWDINDLGWTIYQIALQLDAALGIRAPVPPK